MEMKLRRLPWWQKVILLLSPRRRRCYEAGLLAGIRFAVEHPDIQVRVE